MKVYIAEREYNYEGFIIIGVFTTEEKAQEACDNDKSTDGMKHGDSHQVEVFEVFGLEEE